MTWLLLVVVLFLAWSNGANDNFKGVATLYGAGTIGYRKALVLATVTQVAGSLLTLVLAAGLVKTFSARGLVPDAVATAPAFLTAAALGAALTVLMATRAGMPVSTTHALTGALVGAGLASRAGVHLAVLGKSFFLPLLLSPILAMLITLVLYPLARRTRRRWRVDEESCVCVGEELVATTNSTAVAGAGVQLAVTASSSCAKNERAVGVTAQSVLNALHVLSAGAVCFARGLNDAPKVVALMIAAKVLGAPLGLTLVAGVMATGGIVSARRVAETMSKKIVPLNNGQGFVANLTTAALVIAASRFGLPVSTTHVATGGIFGIGAATSRADRKTVTAILVAWATTLPAGALLGAVAYLVLSRV